MSMRLGNENLAFRNIDDDYADADTNGAGARHIIQRLRGLSTKSTKSAKCTQSDSSDDTATYVGSNTPSKKKIH